MFFDGWFDLLRILIVGLCAYAGLVLILRTTGKRTLSKMNAFDFVVTVALGSTLASAVLSSDVSVSEAVLAFALLCGLQFAITFLSVRSRRVQHLIKSEPALLAWQGTLLPDALRRERVTEDEVLAVFRASGKAALSSAYAVVRRRDQGQERHHYRPDPGHGGRSGRRGPCHAAPAALSSPVSGRLCSPANLCPDQSPRSRP